MNHSKEIANLAKALLAAQKDRKNVVRDKDVVNNYGKHMYSHADLQQVLDNVIPIYNKFGVVVLQPHDGLGIGLMLLHESGEYLYFKSELTVEQSTNREGFKTESWGQALGKALTYARRYGLMGAAGITQTDTSSEEEGEAPIEVQVKKEAAKPVTKETLITLNELLLKVKLDDRKPIFDWFEKIGIKDVKDLTEFQGLAIIKRLKGKNL